MELTQGVGVFRPAKGREGPQRRREPGVENVFVLTQGNVGTEVIFLAHFFFVAANINITRFVIPCRDTVTPPQLTRDTPVLNIAHPGEIHVFVLLRYELNVAVLNRFNRRFRQYIGTHVPLVGQHWFDNYAATVAVRNGQVVRFNFFQQAECVNRSNDCFTCGKTLQFLEFCRDLAGINVRFVTFGIEHLGAFTDIAVKGQDVDHRQGVTFTDFIVVKVVRRGDLHAAGAFFHVGVFVANDRNTTVNQR